MVAEAVGGYVAGSLALLADAGHMLTDVAALGLALVVAHLCERPVTPQRSYGLQRLEILAALVNGAALIVIAVGIGIEAWQRLRTPPAIHARLLLGVASLGLVANVVSARILHSDHDHSLNQRGAYLHVLSDTLDPLISVGIGLLILHGAWRLVKESTDVLLEATPRHISLSEVHDRMASIPGVASVHDLHVWTVTSGVVAMSGHLVVQNPQDNQRVLEAVQQRLGHLGIDHVTVQMERDQTCE
ncbi:MAG: hypothetical protein AUI19_03095 [Myxococcales bacterium 13_1_40CM_2_68_15]|nr:MAG: hypothetical protein AUI19_03095 [Myxococcales bacterium 13_1_40CM_2_68_15]